MLKGDKAREGKGKVGNRLKMKGPAWSNASERQRSLGIWVAKIK